MNARHVLIGIFAGSVLSLAQADVKTAVARVDAADGSRDFRLKDLPRPAKEDAGRKGRFLIIDGERDRNGGEVSALNDGQLPLEADQPAANFFFNAGTPGGRVVCDLGEAIDIKAVNSYSWHISSRAPQVYELFAADGRAAGFNPQPKRPIDPTTCGWQRIATVDTRAGTTTAAGGQYAVNCSSAAGSIGKYRFLLFDIVPTETTTRFGNTFFSEIDVIATGAQAAGEDSPEEREPKTIAATAGKHRFTIDVSLAPDLAEWSEKELMPVVQEWYPKVVHLLPSEGFEAPAAVLIEFKEGMRGTPAYAARNGISCNIEWFRRNLKGEARGAVVHELVHVVQQYGRARRNNPEATRTPGWLVEGIADYIRWFLYEPQSKGAEISARNIERARYDGNYRVTANFMNWVVGKYDKEIVKKLNAAAREGKYRPELWKEFTGKTVEELGVEWKKEHEERIARESAAPGAP